MGYLVTAIFPCIINMFGSREGSFHGRDAGPGKRKYIYGNGT